MFDWLTVKSTLKDARNEMKNMRATIAQNKLRIEELKRLPPPRAELADMIDKYIDEVGAFYPQKMSAALQSFILDPINPVNSKIIDDEGSSGPIRVLTATEAGSINATPKTIERALFYILADQIKAGARKAILEMEYPAIVGPTMALRQAEIKKLANDNADFEAKVKAIELDLAQTVDANN